MERGTFDFFLKPTNIVMHLAQISLARLARSPSGEVSDFPFVKNRAAPAKNQHGGSTQPSAWLPIIKNLVASVTLAGWTSFQGKPKLRQIIRGRWKASTTRD